MPNRGITVTPAEGKPDAKQAKPTADEMEMLGSSLTVLCKDVYMGANPGEPSPSREVHNRGGWTVNGLFGELATPDYEKSGEMAGQTRKQRNRHEKVIDTFNFAFVPRFRITRQLNSDSPSPHRTVDILRKTISSYVHTKIFFVARVKRYVRAARVCQAVIRMHCARRRRRIDAIVGGWAEHETRLRDHLHDKVLSLQESSRQGLVLDRTKETTIGKYTSMCFIPQEIKEAAVTRAYRDRREMFRASVRLWMRQNREREQELQKKCIFLARVVDVWGAAADHRGADEGGKPKSADKRKQAEARKKDCRVRKARGELLACRAELRSLQLTQPRKCYFKPDLEDLVTLARKEQTMHSTAAQALLDKCNPSPDGTHPVGCDPSERSVAAEGGRDEILRESSSITARLRADMNGERVVTPNAHVSSPTLTDPAAPAARPATALPSSQPLSPQLSQQLSPLSAAMSPSTSSTAQTPVDDMMSPHMLPPRSGTMPAGHHPMWPQSPPVLPRPMTAASSASAPRGALAAARSRRAPLSTAALAPGTLPRPAAHGGSVVSIASTAADSGGLLTPPPCLPSPACPLPPGPRTVANLMKVGRPPGACWAAPPEHQRLQAMPMSPGLGGAPQPSPLLRTPSSGGGASAPTPGRAAGSCPTPGQLTPLSAAGHAPLSDAWPASPQPLSQLGGRRGRGGGSIPGAGGGGSSSSMPTAAGGATSNGTMLTAAGGSSESPPADRGRSAPSDPGPRQQLQQTIPVEDETDSGRMERPHLPRTAMTPQWRTAPSSPPPPQHVPRTPTLTSSGPGMPAGAAAPGGVVKLPESRRAARRARTGLSKGLGPVPRVVG